MATFRRFEDIEAWKKGRTLTREIARLSSNGAFAADFRFRSQIRSASSSITSNIAEGYERGGRKEFTQFLAIAKGSAGEVRSQLHDALDFGYITEEEHASLIAMAEEVSRLIAGLTVYLQRSDIEGPRYK